MKTNDPPLKNKVAVITGAGRGIGRAIAIAFAHAGASIVCAARTQREIEDTASTILSDGGQAIAVPTDVTNQTSVLHLFETSAGVFGGIDILVIDAGANYDRRLVEESVPSDWLRTLDVNLTGAYYSAQGVIPYLKKRGAGKIITIGSGLGHHGIAGSSAYSCSKAGLWMLTRILAQELWADNISVNELVPGPVLTTIDDQQPSPRPTNLGFDSEWVKVPEDVTVMALFMATQPDIGPSAQSFSLMRRDNSGLE